MSRHLAFAALIALACSPSTRLAARGAHPPHVQEFVPVPYPPPPARAEEIGYRHDSDRCVWVDGHYRYDARRWTWKDGLWVYPPEGCYYAPSLIAWSKTNPPRLYYTPPRWYRDDASSLPESKATCPSPRVCR
jgi:hypothetical protein